MKNFSSGYGGR